VYFFDTAHQANLDLSKYKQGNGLYQEGMELLDAPLEIPSLPHLS